MEKHLSEKRIEWLALQESLRQVQRQAIAGQFAATIMHEINNPLEAIGNLVYLIEQDPDNPSRVVERSRQIQEQLATLTRIARQTLSFYKPSVLREEVGATTLVEAALRTQCAGINAKRIRIEKFLSSDVTVEAHPGEMLQVVSNLIANAVDAMPVNGTLYLRSGHSCHQVHILVADNGHGIPPAIAGKIFDPFFTTKKEKGTGLGLAIAKTIVERNRGQIRTRSSVKEGRSGTAFRISMPIPLHVALN
jgi:signal transduction histidine kinase